MRPVDKNGLPAETVSEEGHRKSHVFSIDGIEKEMPKNIKKKHDCHPSHTASDMLASFRAELCPSEDGVPNGFTSTGP